MCNLEIAATSFVSGFDFGIMTTNNQTYVYARTWSKLHSCVNKFNHSEKEKIK